MTTPVTIRLADDLRRDLAVTVSNRTNPVVSEYLRVGDEAARELDRLFRLEARRLRAGQTLSLSEMRRQERVANVLRSTQDRLAALAEQGAITVRDAVTRDLVPLASGYDTAMIRSQLPPEARGFGTSLPPAMLESVVARTAARTAYFAEFGRETAAAINRAVVDGVVAGQNPRLAARLLSRRIDEALLGGRYRLERIMRTEMLDAYRNADTMLRNANSDVVSEWEWHSANDERVCASCWALHGERFPNDVPGPDDHWNGRCIAIPVVRRDLANRLGAPQPPSRDELFARLSRGDQLRVLGPTRLDLLERGMPWFAFSTQRDVPGFRTVRVATPVYQLRALAARMERSGTLRRG